MKVNGQFLKTSADSSSFFKPSDALLDHASATVCGSIELDASIVPSPLILFVRNHRADAARFEPRSDTLGSVCFVSRQTVRAATRPASKLRNAGGVEQRLDTRGFMLLAWRQLRDQRSAFAVSNQMKLGSETASAAPQRMVGRFALVSAGTFLLAPAAARAARICVPSTHHKSQSILPSRSSRICSASRMRWNAPSRRQFEKCSYTVCHGPKRSGRSRQGAPVFKIQKMPFHMHRGGRGGRPVRAVRLGSSDSINVHCSSVSSCRFIPTTPNCLEVVFGIFTTKNEFSDRA